MNIWKRLFGKKKNKGNGGGSDGLFMSDDEYYTAIMDGDIEDNTTKHILTHCPMVPNSENNINPYYHGMMVDTDNPDVKRVDNIEFAGYMGSQYSKEDTQS